jgi:O-antigen/teichoic acid export membrane protein
MIAGLGWGMIDAFGVVGAGMAYLTSIILSQFLIVYILYKTIEKPFSGFLSSLLAMVIVALIGAVVAFSMMALIPGAFGLGLAAFVAGLTAIGTGLVFDRFFDLGLLQTFSEPFPRLAAIVDNFIGAKRLVGR